MPFVLRCFLSLLPVYVRSRWSCVQQEKQNKMTLQNVSIVLSPTMQISHRVLNIFFAYSKILFRDTVIKRYHCSDVHTSCLIYRDSSRQQYCYWDMLDLVCNDALITGSIARSANLPVFSLLRGRFWSFSPRRGDTLHRWGWNLRIEHFRMPNFTPIGATTRV